MLPCHNVIIIHTPSSSCPTLLPDPFHPLDVCHKSVNRSLFHLSFQLGPWLAVEIPDLISKGLVKHKDEKDDDEKWPGSELTLLPTAIRNPPQVSPYGLDKEWNFQCTPLTAWRSSNAIPSDRMENRHHGQDPWITDEGKFFTVFKQWTCSVCKEHKMGGDSWE